MFKNYVTLEGAVTHNVKSSIACSLPSILTIILSNYQVSSAFKAYLFVNFCYNNI